ncbi:MAG: putative esterase [Chlamydiales bacterium]|nr:putative esterase [Chlamydiales bacterium]
MTFNLPLHTRYSETAQDGIIHHSSYAAYFEEARIAYFKTIGCTINELEKQQIYCIVADLSIKYLKPLYSDEEIVIHVSLENASKVRFRLSYKILRGNECTTEALSTHCFLNAAFKPIPIPKTLPLH